ncbi:hypothetical protein [Demequina sp. NBRC 110054]|uniref:hypothetical protein n=1 Tax=Demequina sp. NBRC 110054 TaxID=1570343 RepID=UPI0009FC3B71|nr:hypothetical protein [Demequina sp. NBRC 110054]
MSALGEALRDGADAGGRGVAEVLSEADPWEDMRLHALGARRRRTLRSVGVLGAMGGAAMLAAGGWGLAAPAYEFADESLMAAGAVAPTRVAGVDLRCGAELAGALPADRADWSANPEASLSGTVDTGRQATVHVQSAGLPAATTLSATAVLTLDDRIVASMPIAETADGARAALAPGDCLAGEVNPALLAAAEAAGDLGRTFETHLAVVALDSDGEVVGHWFDPPGTSVAFVPVDAAAVVDGWCPVARI